MLQNLAIFFLALTFVQQEYAAKIPQVYIIAVRT